MLGQRVGEIYVALFERRTAPGLARIPEGICDIRGCRCELDESWSVTAPLTEIAGRNTVVEYDVSAGQPKTHLTYQTAGQRRSQRSYSRERNAALVSSLVSVQDRTGARKDRTGGPYVDAIRSANVCLV